MNMVSGDKHVEDMEYLIWVYKECICYYWAMIPFKKIPRVMVTHSEDRSIFVHTFTLKSGVSQYIHPITLVNGVHLDFNKNTFR